MEKLKDVAEFFLPEENAGTSENVRNHLQEWALDREADVIHLNCGRYDLRKEFGEADSILLKDGVHYTPEGYALLGRKVAGFLKERL